MKNTTTLAIACCTAFLSQVGISIYLPAVPAISQALQAAESQASLALAVYLVGMALPMLLWGSLGERLGRKPVLLAALALYALASAAIPMAHNIETFLSLRFVQGLGAGGVSVMARVLVRDSFSGALLAKGLSWLGMTFVIALGIGQFIGSVLQVALGWEAIFYGLALAAIGLICVLQAVAFPARVKADGQVSAWRIYSMILQHPAFLRAALAGGLGYGVIIAFNTCAPLILQGRFEWTATQYGLLGWPISAAYLAGALTVNRWVARSGRLSMMTWGVTLVVGGSSVMLLAGWFASDWALLLWLPYCVAVFGQSMSYPISLSLANDHSPVGGSYAMALSGFLHQLMAALIGGMASLLVSQQVWPLAALCVALASGALWCVVRARTD
ncbi:putative transporter-like membrane protein [Pseudomonas sp. FH4]|uniref:Multidrug effflux MFS transporter n=1 Tax=Pseudomonas brenneri TaxID=129817 RepID=A0A5B2UQ67_9PSED|nr:MULTISPECIES: MFS transporter [Pseudomonas]MDZ4302789.1 MFS transporter [Pseudomonas sp.]ETK19978.1 putative transporter-like membrane protein [Pseudomonas sp. FH4]KAA2227995.1 multidrug effflux MFS transporter [Pseudomonas brenneri]MBF8005962.1 MFS transporter [Pseudomonas brenneri]TWR78769.1 multidrug effflux MFS transporter [Pseudomonas brenneri]